MLTLAFETATIPGSVAIVDGAQPLAEHTFEPPQQTAQWLAPTIRHLFAQLDSTINEVELIGCTRGPGSFTGLRIGVTTAKMLAYALDCPVVGLDTLDVIAAQVPPDTAKPLDVILAAHRQQLFVRSYAVQDAAWQPTGETVLKAVADWQRQANAGPPRRVAGPAAQVVSDHLEAHVQVASAEFHFLPATTVARLAQQRQRQGQSDDIWQLQPKYVRGSYVAAWPNK